VRLKVNFKIRTLHYIFTIIEVIKTLFLRIFVHKSCILFVILYYFAFPYLVLMMQQMKNVFDATLERNHTRFNI
jgi:hypothetical protein